MRMTPSFAFSQVERSLKECLASRRFGKKEIQEVLSFFEMKTPECVYCGSKQVKRWDHIIPIKKGGETVLGNMIPACSSCDDSKRDLRFDEFMSSDLTNSPKSKGTQDISERKENIYSYMKHFKYTPKMLEERLNEEEMKRYQSLMTKLKSLRKEADKIIEDYNGRRT